MTAADPRDTNMGACLLPKEPSTKENVDFVFFQISHLEHRNDFQGITPAFPTQHMAYLDSQGDALDFISTSTD